MQWFYLDADQLQVPADEGELGGLIQNGTITAGTLLWNETMPDWQAASDLFPDWFATETSAAVEEPRESAPAPAPSAAPRLVAGRAPTIGLVKRPIKTARSGALPSTRTRRVPEEAEPVAPSDLVKDLASYVAVHAGWIKFFGVMSIIGGVLNCLSVIGALIGWLPIWLGVILLKAANAAVAAQFTGAQDDLEEALDRMGFYFKLQGILVLVGLLFVGALVIAGFVTGMTELISVRPPSGTP